MGIDDGPADQPGDGQPDSPLSRPTAALLVATIAFPTVMALWRSVLPPTASLLLTLVAVPTLAFIVGWAVRRIESG